MISKSYLAQDPLRPKIGGAYTNVRSIHKKYTRESLLLELRNNPILSQLINKEPDMVAQELSHQLGENWLFHSNLYPAEACLGIDIVLLLCWYCVYIVLILLWYCFDIVLILFWCCVDVALMLWWYCVDIILKSFWYCFDIVFMLC